MNNQYIQSIINNQYIQQILRIINKSIYTLVGLQRPYGGKPLYYIVPPEAHRRLAPGGPLLASRTRHRRPTGGCPRWASGGTAGGPPEAHQRCAIWDVALQIGRFHRYNIIHQYLFHIRQNTYLYLLWFRNAQNTPECTKIHIVLHFNNKCPP